MFLLKFLPLLACSTLALAKNMGQCHKIMAPDEPGESSLINITALQQTSLLVFHVTDIEKTNIPLYFNEQTGLLNKEDGFYLCTKELHSDGHCPNVGEFVIKSENGGPQEEIINKLLKKGEKVTYQVTDTGMYCIYTHEESGVGVDYKIRQPYGYLSIDMMQELEVILFVVMPTALGLLIWSWIRWWRYKKQEKKHTSVEKTLTTISMLYYFSVENRRLLLDYLNDNDWTKGSFLWKVMLVLAGFGKVVWMISIYWKLYVWTQSPSGVIAKDLEDKGFFIKILFAIQAVFSGFFAFFPTREATIPDALPFVTFFSWGEQIVTLLIWTTLILALSVTITKANDNKTKKKFQLTRQLVISVPVLLLFTSIFIQFVTSFDTFARSLKKSQSNESVIVNALENSVHYGFVFGMVKNLSYFILPLIIVGADRIWKEEKSEDEYTGANEVELGQFEFQDNPSNKEL